MQNYPEQYPDTYRRSHRMTARCLVQRYGRGTLAEPDFVSGQVTIDRSAAVRRQLSISLIDPDGLIVPDGSDGLAAPYGNEIRVWRGIHVVAPYYGAWLDTTWEVPLGVFRIAQANAKDDGTHLVEVTGYDRSRAVSRNSFTQPWVIGAGVAYSDAITALVLDRLPILDPANDMLVTPTSVTTPLIVIDADQDPWAEVLKMADSVGMEAFFNGDGKFVLQPTPDPDQKQAVWTYEEGEFSVLQEVSKEATDEPGWNGVILTAESTTLPAPIQSIVWDDNPDSPTYYLGAYGKVPMKVSSPYVTTQQQADDMALAKLKAESGGTEQLTIAVVPNIAQDVSDAIRVVRSPIKVDDVALIESMTVPLTPDGAMSITTRRKRSVQ